MNQMEQVRDALANGCIGYEQIANYTGLSKQRVKSALQNARARGRIERSDGRYKPATRLPSVWTGPLLSEWRPYPWPINEKHRSLA